MPPAQRVSVRITRSSPTVVRSSPDAKATMRRGQYQGHNDEDPQEKAEGGRKAEEETPRSHAARSARPICPSAVLQAAAKQCPAIRMTSTQIAYRPVHPIPTGAIFNAPTHGCPIAVEPPSVACGAPVRTVPARQSADRTLGGHRSAAWRGPQPKEGGLPLIDFCSELAIQETRSRGGGKRTRVQACDVSLEQVPEGRASGRTI